MIFRFFLPEAALKRCGYLKKLVKASRALATVNSNVLRLPNPDMLINTIGLQEAKTSTAIENIFTTEDELYKAISDTAREEKINAATKEVLRYREALWGGYHEPGKRWTHNTRSDHQELSED
jgi:Fic family protein